MGEYKSLRPNVDLPGPLVEEEHVLDEHHTGGLRTSGKEAVQDAGAHERFKGRGGSAPDGRGQGDDEEVEHDGETSKVGAQHNSCSELSVKRHTQHSYDHVFLTGYSSGAKHEDIAGLRLVDRVLGHVPFTINRFLVSV